MENRCGYCRRTFISTVDRNRHEEDMHYDLLPDVYKQEADERRAASRRMPAGLQDRTGSET